jgi:hypothetical protein
MSGVSDCQEGHLILRAVTIQTLRDQGLRIFNALQIQGVEFREMVFRVSATYQVRRSAYTPSRYDMSIVGVAFWS